MIKEYFGGKEPRIPEILLQQLEYGNPEQIRALRKFERELEMGLYKVDTECCECDGSGRIVKKVKADSLEEVEKEYGEGDIDVIKESLSDIQLKEQQDEHKSNEESRH